MEGINGLDNVLVLDGGGRGHALAWKLMQSPHVCKVFVGPENGGIITEEKQGRNVAVAGIKVDDFDGITDFVRRENIKLTVIGTEKPLADGIVDDFYEKGLVESGHLIFGPSKEAAKLEGSKAFAKAFMDRYGIPTADFEIFEDYNGARRYVQDRGAPIVVKASGLAAGKGAIVCRTLDEALQALDLVMVKKEFGKAGDRVVIEDFMPGDEASILALTDGTIIRCLASSQDHKPVYDGDKGPNTGGMGAYAPAPVVTNAVMEKVMRQILEPTIKNMANRGSPFRGCLYAGLMIDEKGDPRVVEYNVRFGDPETQPVLSLLQSDLYLLLRACADGTLDRYDIVNNDGAACCVVMASGGYPGTCQKGKKITGIDAANAIPGVYVFHAGTKRDGEGNIITNGGRVLGVTGRGKNIQGAIDAAYRGVREISWEGEYHRTDIGHRAIGR